MPERPSGYREYAENAENLGKESTLFSVLIAKLSLVGAQGRSSGGVVASKFHLDLDSQPSQLPQRARAPIGNGP